jgi:hypothetical protein
MASSEHNADDLSPSEFVKKIRELGEKKDAEDAERLAALEKEIELGRKEREMRRAGKCVAALGLVIDDLFMLLLLRGGTDAKLLFRTCEEYFS